MGSAVDEGAHFDLYLVDVDIAFDGCLRLEGEKVLDVDVALHLAPEIDVLASESAVDDGVGSYDHLALRVDFTLDLAVDTDVAVGGYFALDDGADRDAAYVVDADLGLYRLFYFLKKFLRHKFKSKAKNLFRKRFL